MRLRNCLGVACLLLALSVGLFLNGVSFKENTSLKMNANSYDRVQLAGADEVTANFGQDFVNPMGISLLDLETFHDLNDYLTEDSYFEINGEKIEEGFDENINFGDIINIHLEWSLTNVMTWTTNDVFSYELPSGFEFTNVQNGYIKNGIQNVGVYTISENMVTIKYTDSEFLKLSNITGTLNVSGKITEKSFDTSDGETIELNIPGVGTIIINVNPVNALAINKSVTKIDTDIYEFKVEVKSITDNTNVVITDTMGKYLELIYDSLSITNNGKEMTDGVTLDIKSVTNFVYQIDKLNEDDEIIITYRAKVLDGGFISSSTDNDLKNTASVKSDELPSEISDWVVVTLKKAGLSKSGSYNIEDNTVTWTIIINPGEKRVTLEDKILDNQEITGNIKVEESDNKGSTYYDSKLVITEDDLEKGYTFAPDFTGNKTYRITFKTKATGDDVQLYNKATIYIGNSSYGDDAKADLWPDISIDKSFASADDRNGIINWNTKVTIPNIDNKFKNVLFKDVLGDGLTLVEDSVLVNGQKVNETTDYKLEITSDGFNIHFGNIESGKIFNISYQTKFDNSESQKFTNTAFVSVNGEEKSDTAEYDYNKKNNYIQKYLDKASDNFDKTGIARWEIKIDQLPNNVNDVYVTDMIPEGMEYAYGSAKLKLNYNPYTTFELEPTIQDDKLVFKLNGYIDVLSADSKGASIFYDSKVTDVSAEQKTYVNKANITINHVTYSDVEARITGKVTNLLSKTAIYDVYTAPIAEYTIKVNEGALDIVKDSDVLRLVDEMGSAIEFIRGTLKINGAIAPADSYDWNNDSHVLTIDVPDKKALTITYSARVTMHAGEELTEENAFNTVTLNGVSSSQGSSTISLKGEVLESSATSSGEAETIYIYKHKDNDKNVPLASVKFKLYELGFTGTGNSFSLTGLEKEVASLVTDSSGYASYSGLGYDKVYKLVEVSTLEDYILDTTVYYFVYPGNDNIVYPEYIKQYEQSETLEIGNEYSKVNINVSKIWADDDYEGRPNEITVYLKRNGEYVLENGIKVSAILNTSNGYKASFDHLDKYDFNGKLYNYSVEEDVPLHYEASYNSTFKIDNKDFTITNTLEKSSLTIKKFVSGNAGDTDKYFTFKVILKDKEGHELTDEFIYSGSYNGLVKSGDVIKLKHGEYVTIEGLPYGTVYDVTELEANSDGYETSVISGHGKITFDKNDVIFTNVKNEGSLTIDKTVTGNAGDKDRYFTFKVILFDKDGKVLEGLYNYTGSHAGLIKSGDVIKLKHGEYIKISGLPIGATYKVLELEANTDGYITDSSLDFGIIDLDGNITSFINHKDLIKESKIPQTGGSDNSSIYGFGVIVSLILGIYFLKKKVNA